MGKENLGIQLSAELNLAIGAGQQSRDKLPLHEQIIANTLTDCTKDIFTFLGPVGNLGDRSKTQDINTQDLLTNIETNEIFDREKNLALALVERIGQSHQQISVRAEWSEDDHKRTGCILFGDSFAFRITQDEESQSNKPQMYCLDIAFTNEQRVFENLPTTYDQLYVVGTLLEAVTKSLSA